MRIAEATRAGLAAAVSGGPVVAPTALADPGPHWSGGLAVSLWTFVPPSPQRPEPAESGVALARLHIAAAGLPGDLPVLAALRDRHATILAELDRSVRPELVLHGDAHPGNLLWSGTGWLWADLEEPCRGPRVFDLAVLVRGQGAAGAATALAAYADVTGEPLPEPDELAWFDRARALEGAVWTLAMAHQHPARYAGRAPALLASVLADRRSMGA